jgi:catechol 2,3-dioxygenase-like lactoylglutathione lyase family enzyme
MQADFLYRALSVGDLKTSVAFYRDGLGFQPVDDPSEEEGAWLERATGLPGARRIRQRLRNGEGIALELYAFEEPAPVGSRERRKNNMYGLTHLAFYVDSVDEWAAQISAAGGKVFQHTRATFRDNGTTMMYCTDPDGIRVELMQAPGERQRFSHSGVCMADVERSFAFYQELAGFQRSDNYELYDHGYFMNLVNELDNVKLRAQMIRNTRGDTIELLEMKSPAAFGAREPLPVNQYGFNYLAFQTDDIAGTAERIGALGGRAFAETRAESEKFAIQFCADPIGARIALIAPR